MNFIKPNLFLLLLFIALACKSENSQNYITSEQIQIPTQVEADSIATKQKELLEAVEKSIPEPIKKKKEEIREKKIENSVFRDEGCCSNEPPPALCCCEPLWTAYLKLYNSGDAEKLAKTRAEDPIFNDCYKKIPSFKKKVDELEMSGEEE
jgi:hypothetical protein